MKLFDIKWPSHIGDDIDITLNYPLYISNNIFDLRENGKRVILEMVDIYPKLILAYSGGMDSSFILCCIRDFINEGKIPRDRIEIFQGIFTSNGVIASADFERAIKFANSLGFNPRTEMFDINDNLVEIENYYEGHNYKVLGNSAFDSAAQNILARKQDGIVIENQIPYNLSYIRTGHIPSIDCSHNTINFSTWDNDIFSSRITPFRLNQRKINYQPYENQDCYNLKRCYQDINSLLTFEKFLHSWMIYLQSYPEMMEILGKFQTIDNGIYQPTHKGYNEDAAKIKQLDYVESGCWIPIKLPNGELFTEKHLLNYDEMKEGEK